MFLLSLHEASMRPPPNLNSERVHVQHSSKCNSENRTDEKEQRHDRHVCSQATGGTYDQFLAQCTKVSSVTMQSEDEYAFGMFVRIVEKKA